MNRRGYFRCNLRSGAALRIPPVVSLNPQPVHFLAATLCLSLNFPRLVLCPCFPCLQIKKEGDGCIDWRVYARWGSNVS